MEIPSGSQTANLPDELITAQGACPAGVKPEGNEIISWNFCAFLREAIFSFPQGAILKEYEVWITEIHELWKEDTSHISEPSNDLGELPVLIFEFLKRMSRYRIDGIPFDLVKVFTYVYQPEGPIIYDDLQLSIDDEGRIDIPHRRWLRMTVDSFNVDRASAGMEPLQLDSNPYFGRITASRLREMLATGKTIFECGGELCPPKLPIANIETGRDPMEGSTNQEPEREEALSEDVEMELEGQRVEESGAKRYSLRQKTLEKRATRQLSTPAPNQKQTPSGRARTQAKGKKPMKGTRMPRITITSAGKRHEDEDGVIDLTRDGSDDDDDHARQPLVHCATRPEYWDENGTRLPDDYWTDIEVHPGINKPQLAVSVVQFRMREVLMISMHSSSRAIPAQSTTDRA
ncbi:hypothetical protein QCA50_014772 [Cerrena zonata]|uniref:Uncharacterized protein n=1 Tax=Cerrena zonata TaxID=2478898 RepID=A0AAW0FL79_9APHY